MRIVRIPMFAAAAAALATIGLVGAIDPAHARPASADDPVPRLIEQSEKANAALMRGDIERYRSLVTLSDDFTLMSPFGGSPTLAADISDATMEAMGRFFRNGRLVQEVVATYASPAMVVLVLIERAHVEVGGLAAQEWPLRVTLVYRRVGDAWQLAHRHADVLVKGVSLKQAAALARGEIGCAGC